MFIKFDCISCYTIYYMLSKSPVTFIDKVMYNIHTQHGNLFSLLIVSYDCNNLLVEEVKES